MGLLDDLKRQAESRKKQEQTGQQTREQSREAVHVALRDAARYFIELAESLNVLKPQVMRHFYASSTRLDQLVQCEYSAHDKRKRVDAQEYFEEATLRFRCVGSRDIKIERDSPAAIKELHDYLWSYNFRFECQEIRNDRGQVGRAVFTVLAQVPSSLAFTGDGDAGQIRLTVKNVETAGKVDYLYGADEVNRALLEELTKLLLAQPNQFRKLGRHQLMTTTEPRPPASRQPGPAKGPNRR